MCGIVCQISYDLGSESSEAVFKKAIDSLQHRGPDGSGSFTWKSGSCSVKLGHRRLQILELSQLGSQPMSNENLTLIFNGEIYNFVELRVELESLGSRFKGSSDTEVLLNAWERWGEAALAKLDGMFALVILDRRLERVTVARDLFGIKPLYFAETTGLISFASEPKALIQLNADLAVPNESRCIEFLLKGWSDRSQETFYKGIMQLLPGHYVSLDLPSKKITQKRWSRPMDVKQDQISDAELRDKLFTSVKRQLRSDVPSGFALSGGLDSSLLAGIGASVFDSSNALKTHSYAIRDEPTSEHLWQELAKDFLGSAHFEHTESEEDFEERLLETVESLGEPFGSSSLLAQKSLMFGVASSRTKVIIEGQGADEIFCGYDGYSLAKILQALRKGKIRTALELLKTSREDKSLAKLLLLIVSELVEVNFPSNRFLNWLRLLSAPRRNLALVRLGSLLRKATEAPPRQIDLREFLAEKPLPVQKRLGVEIWINSLPALLKNSDRNSMSMSVESRVPYLSLPVVQSALSIAGSNSILTRESKPALRKAAVGYVPNQIINRHDKIGFAGRAFVAQRLSNETLELAYEAIRQTPWMSPSLRANPRMAIAGLDNLSQFRLFTLALWLGGLENLRSEKSNFGFPESKCSLDT